MAAAIGIKVANGDFYPILDENAAVKKRLTLTTVHDGQKSVQIDLYKSAARSMADALYIGSLVVEGITPKPKGEPSIELTISSGTDGVINAESKDLGNPSAEPQQLTLALKTFEEDSGDYSDFDIGEESGHSLYEKSASFDSDDEPKKFPWKIFVAIFAAILLALIAFTVWFFVFRPKLQEAKTAAKIEAPAKAEPVKPAEAAKSEPAKSAPAKKSEPAKPAETAKKIEAVKSAEPAKSAAAETAQPAKPAEPEKPAAKTEPVKTEPVKIAASAKQAEPAPVIEKPPKAAAKAPDRTKREAPVYSFKTPQTIPSEGVAYTIRWGDTLWDISEAFYRNAWLYPRIVRHNKIANPNLIVSGTKITIPPR